MERSRWMTNGKVVRRVNGQKVEAQLKALAFVHCDAPPTEQRSEPQRRQRYTGR